MKSQSRSIALLLAVVVAVGAQLFPIGPAQAAGPCYYGAWKLADQGWYNTSLKASFSSQVRYRVGYTCGGSEMDYFHIDYRTLTIKTGIGGGGYYSPAFGARDWRTYNVFDGPYPGGDRLANVDPNRGCSVETCTLGPVTYGTDLYGQGWDPFVTAVCDHCTASGFGQLVMAHRFRTRYIHVTTDVPPTGY